MTGSKDKKNLINYRSLHSEIPTKINEKIVQIAHDCISSKCLEKDAAFEIVKKLREKEQFENLG